MTQRARWGLGLGAVLLAGGAASWSGDPPPPGADPVTAEAIRMLDAVYDAGAWGARLPVAWAAPRIGRLGLTAWLSTLPLADDVRARIDARVASPEFVDELVPFALFVKDTYAAPDEPDFATWARAAIRPRVGAPGYETDLFSFTPPAPAATGSAGVDPALAAQLLRLYDAVYLQDTGAAAGAPVACAADDTALVARMQRARPVVRELLADHEPGLAEGDLRDAVRHVLADDTTLDALTLSLVEFVDAEVCKHYRSFVRTVVRERQVRVWLTEALLDPDRADGWEYLRWHGSRHHAVHVVVDGLQGHLVAALASGKPGEPFLTAVVAEEAADAARKPRARSTTAAPPSSTAALHHAAEHGASQPMPALAAAVASPGFVVHGLSTTPTISVRNLPVAKTGAAVAGPESTGIPNFHFVDRSYSRDGVQQGRPWYFYGNDALRLTALTREAGMRTMFERLDRLETLSCGAQYDEAAAWSFDSFLNLAVGEGARDFGESRCVAELHRRAANEAEIARLRADLLAREPLLRTSHHAWELYDRRVQANEADAVRADVEALAALLPEAMPDYLLWYDPWPDHFAHAKGPFADEIVGPTGELVRLDHWLGRVEDAYVAAGLTERTLYGMVGDHGLTPVRWFVSPEAEFIEGLARAGTPLVWKKISSDEGEGPKLTHRLAPPSMRGLDLVVASTAGGNYMMDFFVDQGDNWGRQPVLDELRALRTLGGATVDVPAELVRRLGDSLDYLVVRGAPCTPEGGVTVAQGPRAGGVSTATIERRGDRVWVGLEGPDLLDLAELAAYAPRDDAAAAEAAALRTRCLAADRADPAGWCTEAEWRTLTAGSPRPDSVVQLAHLYDTDRAGTVNLFPRAGVGYNTKVPGRHAGETFHEKDAFVGLWGAPVTAAAALPPTVNGSVPMALYGWLTGSDPQPGQDGWGWPAWPKGTWAGQ